MKRLILTLGATAVLLSGCSAAADSDYTGPEQFKTVYVDGVKCIVWVSKGGSFGAMQCALGGGRV